MHSEFDALFQHTREAVCLLDAQGRVQRMNPAAAARFGEGDAGRALFADAGDWQAVREALEAEPHGAATTRVLSGDGQPVECEVTCVLLAEDRGVQVIIHVPTVADEAAA